MYRGPMGIKRQDGSGRQFKRFQIELLVAFAAIIMIITFFLDYVILDRSGRAMQQNASNLIAANSRQIELNINSYLERMKTIPTLLFSDETYYLYDATDESIDSYDKVKNEESILNRIVDIGLMENYSDFGIVYSNDHTVGWISHGTMDLFPEGGEYEAFSAYAVNPKTDDGWCFGIGGKTDCIYYIKRLNPNAILVSSTYTRELSSVFVHPEQLQEMTIRLVNDEDVVMYSSDTGEIGKTLPENILSVFRGEKPGADEKRRLSSSAVTDDLILNSNECENGWRVICSVPLDSILRENHDLRTFIFRVSIVMAVIFVLVGVFLIRNLSRPMDSMVTSLHEKAEMDRLSGVMNKTAFQETIESRLTEKKKGDLSVFVIMDMDNFKLINDRLGHAYGDQVIIRVGELLRKSYDQDTLIGRIGGDEFAVYTECAVSFEKEGSMAEAVSRARKIVMQTVTEQMDKVMSAFTSEFKREHEKCELSVSSGIYVTSEETAVRTENKDGVKEDFQSIYKKADYALYISKRAGKSQYTVYEEGKEDMHV